MGRALLYKEEDPAPDPCILCMEPFATVEPFANLFLVNLNLGIKRKWIHTHILPHPSQLFTFPPPFLQEELSSIPEDVKSSILTPFISQTDSCSLR
jgi:hypothetical protein